MTSAHGPWTTGPAALEDALPRHGERVLSKALTSRAGGTMYCVKTRGPGIALRGVKVTLHHFLCSGMAVHYKDRVLPVTAYGTWPIPDPAEDEKDPSTSGSRPSWLPKLMPSHRPCLTGVDNTYSLRHLLIARSQALPTPLHRRQEDISTWGKQGTLLLWVDRLPQQKSNIEKPRFFRRRSPVQNHLLSGREFHH